MALKVTHGSGNIFVDVGFSRPQAAVMLLRFELALAIEQIIQSRGLTQVRAARLFGVSQPRVSNVVRGKIDRFSIDTLVEMIGRAGAHVTISVWRTRRLRVTILPRRTPPRVREMTELRGKGGAGRAPRTKER